MGQQQHTNNQRWYSAQLTDDTKIRMACHQSLFDASVDYISWLSEKWISLGWSAHAENTELKICYFIIKNSKATDCVSMTTVAETSTTSPREHRYKNIESVSFKFLFSPWLQWQSVLNMIKLSFHRSGWTVVLEASGYCSIRDIQHTRLTALRFFVALRFSLSTFQFKQIKSHAVPAKQTSLRQCLQNCVFGEVCPCPLWVVRTFDLCGGSICFLSLFYIIVNWISLGLD